MFQSSATKFCAFLITLDWPIACHQRKWWYLTHFTLNSHEIFSPGSLRDPLNENGKFYVDIFCRLAAILITASCGSRIIKNTQSQNNPESLQSTQYSSWRTKNQVTSFVQQFKNLNPNIFATYFASNLSSGTEVMNFWREKRSNFGIYVLATDREFQFRPIKSR